MKGISKDKMIRMFEAVYDGSDFEENDIGDSWDESELLKANNVLTFRLSNDGIDGEEQDWSWIQDAINQEFNDDGLVAFIEYSDGKKGVYFVGRAEQFELENFQYSVVPNVDALAYKIDTKELKLFDRHGKDAVAKLVPTEISKDFWKDELKVFVQ